MVQVLQKRSSLPPDEAPKQSQLCFFQSPLSFDPSPQDQSRLAQITVEKTAIEGSNTFDPLARVSGTGERLELPAAIAFRSIGYKSEPLPGLDELGIPFDDRLGIIPNDLHGRVLAPDRGPGDLTAAHVPGFYVAGWAKRGPTGVIGSTMEDAFATADGIAQDWHDHSRFLNGTASGATVAGWDGVKAEADRLGLRRVSWADWEKIDAAERQRGRELGKQREKFASVEEMLRVLE